MFSVGVYLCWIILISVLTVITLFMIFAIQMALAFISCLCELFIHCWINNSTKFSIPPQKTSQSNKHEHVFKGHGWSAKSRGIIWWNRRVLWFFRFNTPSYPRLIRSPVLVLNKVEEKFLAGFAPHWVNACRASSGQQLICGLSTDEQGFSFLPNIERITGWLMASKRACPFLKKFPRTSPRWICLTNHLAQSC